MPLRFSWAPLLLASGLFLGACGAPTQPAAATNPAADTAATVAPATDATPTLEPSGDLQQIDWATELAATDDLAHPEVPADALADAGPYVSVGEGENQASGYALVDQITYGDLTGDGQDEAIIHLASGGTAGITGVLLYGHDNKGKVALVGWLPGYKISASVTTRPDGSPALLVQQPIYGKWDANCCPSGIATAVYTLSPESELTQIEESSAGIPEMRVPTVERFYQFLSEQNFADAYAFLSPDFQAKNPFAQWQQGYQTTQNIAATVSEGANGAVNVELTATDKGAPQKFTGTWSLIWSEAAGQWLLDVGAFKATQAQGNTGQPGTPDDFANLDWAQELATSDDVNHPDAPTPAPPGVGPYVSIGSSPADLAAGYALIDTIRYGDLDGDGVAEAVIPLESGGTAGITGFLIYGHDNKGVVALVGWLPAYKGFASITAAQNGRAALLVEQPVYGKWDGNCCPSGLRRDVYLLDKAAGLQRIDGTNEGNPEAKVWTVERFYQFLAEQNYQDAYAFLSPAFQAKQPFAQWAAGYGTTANMAANVSANANGTVTAVVSATDNGVAKTFTFLWTLIWSPEAGQWLLDQAQVQ